ncbi:MAG: putative transcriptional regulator [Anaerocolumna sp.]|jgi:BlaI family penicillinase repressor|nr:putative transcriptional regulator [Anaerocolumna sp.]
MNNISDAEWKVMRVLWNRSPITSGEIIEQLITETNWNPKTIHTLLRRLVSKGAVTAKKEKTYYSYSAEVSEEECIKQESETFLDKCFNGSLNMLLSNFIKGENLSEKDIDDLQSLLDSKKSRR